MIKKHSHLKSGLIDIEESSPELERSLSVKIGEVQQEDEGNDEGLGSDNEDGGMLGA